MSINSRFVSLMTLFLICLMFISLIGQVECKKSQFKERKGANPKPTSDTKNTEPLTKEEIERDIKLGEVRLIFVPSILLFYIMTLFLTL